MLTVTPSIPPEVYRIAPGFRALSIYVKAAPVLNPGIGETALREACEAVLAGEPKWAEAHLAAWAEVFQKFGAKPKRTPCSADALRKRVLRDGTMPALDPIVDLYNAVSLRYVVPVGGENIAAYQGSPHLAVAKGTEPFDTIKEGETAVEYPLQGEVIWRDNTGVTCRRWNWRQGIRTRLGVEAQHMWFILESLPQMPLETLHEAGKMLTDGLEKMMPGMWFEVALTRHVSVPVCIYDNPGTTHFTFTDELHGRLSSLEGVRSVKIPGVPDSPAAASERVVALRQHLRPGVTIGISGDAYAGLGLNAGCEVWYSVCGGLFPETAKQITEAAAAQDHERVTALTARLEPLWALFRKHGGSIRVIAAAAGVLGLTDTDCLPRPLQPLSAGDIADIAHVIRALELK